MNIQTRKLSLIEGLMGVNDSKLLLRFETFLNAEISKAGKREKEITPMTMKEYHQMIDGSLEDVQNGRIVEHSELKKEIGRWAGK